MDTVFIPGEKELRKWVKEAVLECLQEYYKQATKHNDSLEDLLSREQAARILHISLVTLTDWMKRGLPFHKQRGRVYFIRSEVMKHIKEQRWSTNKKNKKFSALESEIENELQKTDCNFRTI